MVHEEAKNLAVWLESMIKVFINESSDNSLRNAGNEKAWADPLVGFSSGDDPIYQKFKEDIGQFYLTPLEIFVKTFPRLSVASDQLTVISWVLPQTEATKSDNRRESLHPSERWVRARIYGEESNKKLHEHVVDVLQRSGFQAVAPMFSPFYKTDTSERYGLSSAWSARHVAYASGLGTFGLCDGLITPKGKAVRLGSVVAFMKIPPSKRSYMDHHSHCLFFSKGLCGRCVTRCPVGAITKAGHDKEKCRNYLESSKKYVRKNYGFEGYGCGLCQTGVPCESRIPAENDL